MTMRPHSAAATLTQALADATTSPLGCFVFVDRREREERVDFATVHERALAAAAHLAALGVEPGERVALVLPTGQPFMDAFFGIQLAGAVPVPLYPPVRLGRLDEYVARTVAMLGAADCVAIVTDRRVQRLLGTVLEEARPRLGLRLASALVAQPAPGSFTAPAVGPDDLALVQFSSGTTRAPKPVALTHAQVLANVDAIASIFPDEVPGGLPSAGATWLPLYHDMGLIGCVCVAVRLGRLLALLPPEVFLARPALWLRMISRHRAVISPGPNFAYGRCVEKIDAADLEGVDLSSWRLALNGAEPVSAVTCDAFIEKFAPMGLRPEAMMPVYGLSECALAVTFDAPDRRYVVRTIGDATTVGVGRPLPGFEVRIVDDAGRDLPAGSSGRIHVRGPSVMRGYLSDDPSPIDAEGWLDTGDLGLLHDGELHVTGRAKELVILRGRNWAPTDIEAPCDDVPGVRPGCAVALGDMGPDGERLLVFVEFREATEGLAEAVREAVLRATGLDAQLVLALEPGTLPRTSSGKLRRVEALRRWRAGELTPPRRVTPWMLAGAMAKSTLSAWRARADP